MSDETTKTPADSTPLSADEAVTADPPNLPQPDGETSETVSTTPVDAKSKIQIGSQRATYDSATGEEKAIVEQRKRAEAEVDPYADIDPAELLNRRYSDQDLEAEIAAAMGDSVEDLLSHQGESQTEIEIDERYTARVVKIHRDSVLFELPGQRNGFVPVKQFEELPEEGAELEVVVTGFSSAEQLYDLSIPGASVSVADWGDLAEGLVVEAAITGHNKGGLECEVNKIRGFIPASQVSLYRIEDFSVFVDQRMTCVVTEANEEKRNLVLSHRAILEREREQAKEKILAELEVGQTRDGTVTRLQNFGAFVDLGGVDGLIHISQLSWDNIRHPSEVISEGQNVRVRIEKFDRDTGKIGLSYRDLMHNPWEGIEGKYAIGAVVTGTVSKIMDFGAFVKLESGVEGLVHISELSHKRVNRVSHAVEEGQQVEVKVLTVDGESQRIGLSIKQALGTVESEDESDTGQPEIKSIPKHDAKSLKGGVGKSSGGEQFGLKW